MVDAINRIIDDAKTFLNVLKKTNQSKSNPDWWLHLKDKYDFKDRFYANITLFHKYESEQSKDCEIEIILNNVSYSDIKMKKYKSYKLYISIDELKKIKNVLYATQINIFITDRIHVTNFDYIKNIICYNTKEIISIGKRCNFDYYYNVILKDVDGVIYNIKYMSISQIKKICRTNKYDFNDVFSGMSDK